ncbi:NADPH-dependent medium chain alcohol dehydrogenase [Komagataella phaffii]|uniref:alcohol dehydrogenase (NADP(+)) n=1 Tax=Komagataella phaffii (strain GS115 / ATCC 20864) TaxID=644223 RepID=C4R8B0_KOMPG|nr:NADPH-dependent medium chain alcohol dehydrogenase with broad substrate specificity [Komagataella phaffii GS115]AOA64488.1 GQ67_04947T0 [Komagataella phaffii]AOA69839.1 GQ68_04928T0 [Komagataella phaffii GS115]CAY71835.1 NADPH-dependent medium chain alcohol dehydrogenase with broad substrate specificity [Komagataella phaffii GS115]
MAYPDTFEGFAVTDTAKWSTTKKIEFTPKRFQEHDIDVKIHACGICGSDVHTVCGGWAKPDLPVIPGHEIVGEVVRVGPKVKGFEIGQRVGVGAQVWACLECDTCKDNNETYCPQWVDTYNATYPDGDKAWGGYSSHIRVHDHFVFPIPDELPTNAVAPMLCAGITTYSPLVRNGAGPGKKVGIIGIGGLGHFAIMWARALGCEVYTFSRTHSKEADAKKLGTDHFIATWEDKDWAKKIGRKLDFIISCGNSATNFDMDGYLSVLKVHGKLISVGLPEEPFTLSAGSFIKNGCYLGSSHLGNRQEMLDMLKLAADKGIGSWYEELPISEEGLKEGLERCHNNDVKYRFTLTGYDKAFK